MFDLHIYNVLRQVTRTQSKGGAVVEHQSFIVVYYCRDKNHYTSIPTFAFLDYYRPIDVDLFKSCFWSVIDLHVEEIRVLPVSQFLLFMIPMLYTHMRMYMYMYSDCDYLLSLQILFVYLLALPSLYFILQFYSIIFYTC